MSNIERSFLDKIFRPNRFSRVFEIRSQILRLEKLYSQNLFPKYCEINSDSSSELYEMYINFKKIYRVINEKLILKEEGEVELIIIMLHYRNSLIEICVDRETIEDILNEIRIKKIKDLT